MKKRNNFEIIRFFGATVWEINPAFIGIMVCSCLIRIIFPFINVIFPMLIIDELITYKRIFILTRYVIFMIVMNGAYYALNEFFENSKKVRNEKLMLDIQAKLSEKFVAINYSKLEDAKFLDLESKALFPIIYQNSLIKMFDETGAIITAIFRIIGLGMILSSLNIWMILLLVVSSALYVWCHKKLSSVAVMFHKELEPINRKFTYYIHMVTDYKRAKDIRIYHAEPLVSEKIGAYNLETYSKLQKLCKINATYGCIGRLSLALQKVITYGYVMILAVKKQIALGEFTMYVTAISQLADSVNDAIRNYIDFQQNCNYLCDYVDLIHICDSLTEKQQSGSAKMPEMINTIEFKQVTFSYDGMDTPTVKNVSFKLEKGTKTAMVGKNGAGKTTVIKLLLRFFEPQEGKILLNGIDINSFEVNEYRDKIAAVFQDFFIPSASIKNNIMIGKDADMERLQNAFYFSEMNKIIEKCENGIETVVGKEFDENGIELSGGERQKMAIARMIYKNAPMILLDEPTASLDPRAEEAIYKQMHEISNPLNMIVFISHRLSSCRFCDHILVFENGALCESGKHEELLKVGGVYKKMWEAQSRYYQNAQ